jgi:peptidyl-tRNA hydrolase, PTH1 family
MLLFAGLGNKGEAFASHRHNAGFMATDAIARANLAPAFRARFQGVVGHSAQTPNLYE